LERSTRQFYNPTTSEDPVIKELADKGTVFATDGIVSHLMACTRSIAPWDLVITKSGTKIYFDKRDGSQFDIVTVNETALEPPVDDGSLAREATFINQMFSQQVLKKDNLLKLLIVQTHSKRMLAITSPQLLISTGNGRLEIIL